MVGLKYNLGSKSTGFLQFLGHVSKLMCKATLTLFANHRGRRVGNAVSFYSTVFAIRNPRSRWVSNGIIHRVLRRRPLNFAKDTQDHPFQDAETVFRKLAHEGMIVSLKFL